MITTISHRVFEYLTKDVSRRLFLASALTLAASYRTEAEAGDLVLTAPLPGIESTSQANLTTESFDTFSTGLDTSLSSSIGTLSSPGMSISTDQNSGIGGAHNYLAAGGASGRTTDTLILDAAQNSLGFYRCATDPFNITQFYNGTRVLGSVDSTAALRALASHSQRGASSTDIRNNDQDPSETFAYVDVTDAGSPGIASAVSFGGSEIGFEIDNTRTGTASSVPNVTMPNPVAILTSELSATLILGTAVAFLVAGLGLRWLAMNPPASSMSPAKFAC